MGAARYAVAAYEEERQRGGVDRAASAGGVGKLLPPLPLPLLPFLLLVLVVAGAFGIDPASVRPVASVGAVVSAGAALVCLMMTRAPRGPVRRAQER